MRPFGSLEFTIQELPTELWISRLRHAGWIERILAPAVVPPLVAIGWFWQEPLLIVAASGLIGLLIFRWSWGHPSTLRVLSDRLITSVYLWNQTETALSDIATMSGSEEKFSLRMETRTASTSRAPDAANVSFPSYPSNKQWQQPTRSRGNFLSTPSTCRFLDRFGLRRLPI